MEVLDCYTKFFLSLLQELCTEKCGEHKKLKGKKVNSKLSESPEFIFIVLAQQVL